MGLGKYTGWPFHDLDPRSRLWHRLAKICLSARLSENHSSNHYKTWHLYCPSHGYYLVGFWRSSVGNCYFGKFSLKISDVFFQGQTLFWPYLRNVRLMWNEKEVHRLDTGHNMWPWPLTSLMTLTLDVSRSNFEISSYSGIVGLIDGKWKRSELIWYWADCMTLPFDHTHDLDPGVEISRTESEIALSQE